MFDVKFLVKGKIIVYFDLNGIWFVFNEESGILRNDIMVFYIYIVFIIEDYEFEEMLVRLKRFYVNILSGREWDECDWKLIYFIDLDGYKFEFYIGIF